MKSPQSTVHSPSTLRSRATAEDGQSTVRRSDFRSRISNFKARSPQSRLAAAAAALGPGTNELRDIKPPVEIPSGWAWVWWALAALAIAALLFWAWRRWQRRRAQVPPVPVIPPHVRAKLKLLEALALIERPLEFCTLVSDTIRLYLEERFDFHAPERTTEEFLYELQGTRLLTDAQKQSLGQFLQRCDLVKFARYEPGQPELRDLHAAALQLVEETEPVVQQPGPGAGADPMAGAPPKRPEDLGSSIEIQRREQPGPVEPEIRNAKQSSCRPACATRDERARDKSDQRDKRDAMASRPRQPWKCLLRHSSFVIRHSALCTPHSALR